MSRALKSPKLREEIIAQYIKGIMIGKQRDNREVQCIQESQNNMIDINNRTYELNLSQATTNCPLQQIYVQN